MAKINDQYDIGAAFESIENELIASMIRNMKRHKQEEIDEDKQWSMWQAEQLKALEKYKKENQKKYGQQFKDINDKIESLIRIARDEGEMQQEIQILNAIKKGFPAKKVATGATAEFFKLNNRKLEALIKATTDDMQKAETAVLRMADDKYRKVIYNAQVYANTGAGTYEKAIDMATKDFLSAGLNCIEYANGARHTIADYADMAIRTACKRAYLQGEGQKRQEWGISTVIVNKRGNPCPLCLPFVGKVLIDDVWSNGPKDGKSPETGIKYPLMSSAVAAGLYHPRCRDSHTTYFEGISTPPDDKYTKEELDDLVEKNRQEARRQYAQRQEKKFGRLAKHSLDPENREVYGRKEKEWSEQTKVLKPAFTQAKTIEEAQQYAGKFLQKVFMDKTFNGVADLKGISLDNANAINRALHEIYSQYDIEKISGIKAVSPISAKGKKAFKDGADAIASYDPIQHGIYLNKDILGSEKKFAEYVKKSDDAWEIVMKNRNSLTGAQRELADTYAKAGRSLVDGKTIEGIITHEMGHHVQWSALDTRTNNLIGSRMKDYAPQISGYANASKGEYLAESFAAYMNGERELLDPDFADFIDAKRIGEREFSPRKAKKGNFGVDWKNVQSPEYRKSLGKLSDNKKAVDAVEVRAKWALNNRDGLKTEELYAVSLDTREEIASILDQQIEFGIRRTESFTKKTQRS